MRIVTYKNVHSFLDMNINRQEYKSKRLTKTSNVGKWNSDMPGAIDYKTGAVTAKLAATNVYKVVVVIVSRATAHSFEDQI